MAIVNITVSNDSDFYRTFQYIMTSGTPIDITGVSMEMMLRRHAADAEALLRLGTDTGDIVLTDPFHGLFTVMIRQPELERLGLGDFDHSNIMTSIGGLKVEIWRGLFTNNAGATR
jgi:hypothetical protein